MTGVDDRLREPYPLHEPDASLGDLVGRLTGEVGELFSDHLELARLEIVDEMKQAARGAGMLGAAAIAGWLAALLLSFALAWGLAEALDLWLAFLIVGGLWGVVAAGLAVRGKRQIEEFEALPEETMQELERDKQWIREHKS